MRREHDAEDAKRKAEAREKAAAIWQAAASAPDDHVYLRRKGMLEAKNPVLSANEQPGLNPKTQNDLTAVRAQEKHLLALEISLPREIELAIKRLQCRKVEIGASLVADEALKKLERRNVLSGKDRDYLHQAARSLADYALRQRWGI